MAKQSSEKSRFTDFWNEPIDHLLLPIKGYQDVKLLPLNEAVHPIATSFNEIEEKVFIALHNCQNPSDGLDQQESSSIHLYTMHFDDCSSLYLQLNRTLRAENREELKPWFPFLKLFLTGLHKLPSYSGTVWRGIKDVDLTSKYKKGTKFAWWGISSCTTDLEVLESNAFFGKHGLRTLFSIECINGKSIDNHSYFKSIEKEVVLMPGSYFEVTGQLNPAPQLYIIHLKEIKPPIQLLKPPFSTPTKTGSSCMTNLPNSSNQPKTKVNIQHTRLEASGYSTNSKVTTTTQFDANSMAQKMTSNTYLKETPVKSSAFTHSTSTVTKLPVKEALTKPSIEWNHAAETIFQSSVEEQSEDTDDDENKDDQKENSSSNFKLCSPQGIFIADNQEIYVADTGNNRIIYYASNYDSKVIAGGNGCGPGNHQMDNPIGVIFDKNSKSLIVADVYNRRVMRWFLHNDRKGQVIIPDTDCYGLAMDDNGYIYISESSNNVVRRWKLGDEEGTIIAGTGSRGSAMNELDCPTYILVDDEYSLYVTDASNHRVMKWMKDADEGIVVAGGNGQGSKLSQLNSPGGIAVNQYGELFVVDTENHRVTRWCNGKTQGIVVGGYGSGREPEQLDSPCALSFDQQNNLYVLDSGNDRLQKFTASQKMKTTK